jgi:DNA polymerase I-like protein with 3'-5' exonuclease and polymerase domains
MITLDFETQAIVEGAPLLPEPVGCAIRWPGSGLSQYFSWGHPTNNNCTKDDFAEVLRNIWDEDILTHNGATFDIPVAAHWFGLPERDPLLTHDTLFLAYLHDPHARSLSLKDLAADWLGIPPDGQTELYKWIMANTDCRSLKKAGGYIAQAPGDLVGRYACDDVEMTYQLYLYCKDKVLPVMQGAYTRELMLAPILVGIQNQGVLCDVERLRRDTLDATHKLHALDQQIREYLGVKSLSVDKDADLIAALKAKGHTNFLTTPTGRTATNKDSLNQALADAPELRELLRLRGVWATLVGTFMGPWLEIAEQNGGRIHASYNQVRNPDGFGTRTGRLSSSKPNFQNVPGDLGPEFYLLRSYLLPERDHVWVCGDFKNQEPRITAHFEDGALLAQYQAEPTLDPYLWVASICGIARKEAKEILLGLIYAMGAGTLGDKLGCSEHEAIRLRNMVKLSIPDVLELEKDCKRRFRMGIPLATMGGRLYNCEPSSNGRSWDYKALNTLIQGSAADQTKEAIIYVSNRLLPGERVLGTVHDEISISCPPDRVDVIKQLLAEGANALPCDVHMLMDIKVGNNWAEAK